jgi:Transposase
LVPASHALAHRTDEETLLGHRELILNYFRAKKQFSSGVIEGLNNKAKLCASPGCAGDPYFPGFLEPRRIAGKALTAVVKEGRDPKRAPGPDCRSANAILLRR